MVIQICPSSAATQKKDQIGVLQENSSACTMFFIPPKDLAVPAGNRNMLNKRLHRNDNEKKIKITSVREQYLSIGTILNPLLSHWTLPLKVPGSV